MKMPVYGFPGIVCLSLFFTSVYAELVDTTQANAGGAVNAPGGLVGKSLEDKSVSVMATRRLTIRPCT